MFPEFVALSPGKKGDHSETGNASIEGY